MDDKYNMYFFYSKDCDDCAKLKKEIKDSGILGKLNYLFVDGLDDNTQEFCDYHNVDKMPRVKIFDSKGNLALDKTGLFDISELEELLK